MKWLEAWRRAWTEKRLPQAHSDWILVIRKCALMETKKSISGTVLDWVPHSSSGYVCLLLATGDGSSCAIVNLRERVAVGVRGSQSSREIRNNTVADVHLASKPFTDQYNHTDVKTEQYWASSLTLRPGTSAQAMSTSVSRLSQQTPPLSTIVQCSKNEGLTDILGRVERIEPYSHDERMYLYLRDETTTIRVIVWPEHKKRLPNIVKESTVLYMKNIRFKYDGSYFASSWNMFVFADLQNPRTDSLKRMSRSNSGSLTYSPLKLEVNAMKNDIKLNTLKELAEGTTGSGPVLTECQIRDLVSTDFIYQACIKCLRKLQVRRDNSNELEYFCASCKHSQITPNHRYKIMVWLKDETPLVELKAFLDHKVAENLLGMTADKLYAMDSSDQNEFAKKAIVDKWFTMRMKCSPDRFMPGQIKHTVLFAVEKAPAIQDCDVLSIEEITDSSDGMQPAIASIPHADIELPDETLELSNASDLQDMGDFGMSEISSSLPECTSGKKSTSQTLEISDAAKFNGDARGSVNQASLPSYSRSHACLRPKMPQIGKRYADRTESSDEELMSPSKNQKRAHTTQSKRIIAEDSSDEEDDDSQMNKLVQQKCFLPGYYTLAKYGSGYYPAVISKLPTARVGYHMVRFLDSGREEEVAERNLLRPSVWLKKNRGIWVFTARDRSVVRTGEHYESGILLDLKQRKGKPSVYKTEVIRDRKGNGKVRKIFNVRFRDVAVMDDIDLAGINRPYGANIGAEAGLDDNDVDEWESEASIKLCGDSEDDMQIGSGADSDQDFIDDAPQEYSVPSPSVSSGRNAVVVNELDELNDDVAEDESEESHVSDEENGDENDDEEDDQVMPSCFAIGECVFAKWDKNGNYYVADVKNVPVAERKKVPAAGLEKVVSAAGGKDDSYTVLFREEEEARPVDDCDIQRLTDVVKGGHRTMYFCDEDNDQRVGTIDKIKGEGAETTVRIRFSDNTRETHGLERLCFTEGMIKRKF